MERADKLRASLRSGGTGPEHNEELLSTLTTRGNEGFAILREIVRFMNQDVTCFKEILLKLKAVGWNVDDESKH